MTASTAVCLPSSFLRLARRIRPNRWASCLREPKCDEIWIKHVASGKSMDVSPTFDKKMQLTVTKMSV